VAQERRTSAAASEMIDPETGEVIAETLPADGFVADRRQGVQIRHPASQAERAKAAGISRHQQIKLDALAKAGRGGSADPAGRPDGSWNAGAADAASC
jgi:hypothetical protein